MTLYKNVLHNPNNTLPKWYLESIGVYVSHLNHCDYCVAHHFEGFRRLINDDQQAEKFRTAVMNDRLEYYFSGQYLLGCSYAKKLALDLSNIEKADIAALIQAGFAEGEILEINQVASYFNYVNRTVVGLGVDIKGDILGLSPNSSGDPNSWNHQ